MNGFRSMRIQMLSRRICLVWSVSGAECSVAVRILMRFPRSQLVVRIRENLNFANTGQLKDRLRRVRASHYVRELSEAHAVLI